MSRPQTVLVFPCGSENGGEIFEALRHSLHVKLIGASSVDDHGRMRFPDYVGDLPLITDPDFDTAFAALLRHRTIDLVFATHDTVAAYLAPRMATLGATLVNGDPATTAITRQKSLTYALFEDCDWVPRSWAHVDDIEAWPVIVKPDRGQGAQGVILAAGAAAAAHAAAAIQEPVLVEYLPGQELTVDCFTDRHRRLVWVGPRSRERVRAGISMRSEPVPLDDQLIGMAETINARLALRGPWFFQVKQDCAGRWKLLEISSRVAGTMVAARARGVNLPLMAVHDFMERDVAALVNPQIRRIERCIATRAELAWDFRHVYVDLDDTLIIDGRAVPSVIAFLYQCAAQGKQLHLVTRHVHAPCETLLRARIAPTLFDTIHHLSNGESKADCMRQDAIFLDNHFPERLDVATRLGIPVFDVDAVSLLLR